MKSNSVVRLFRMSALCLVATLELGLAQDRPAQPNFVILLADDLGWQDIKNYDTEAPYSVFETPYMDGPATTEHGFEYSDNDRGVTLTNGDDRTTGFTTDLDENGSAHDQTTDNALDFMNQAVVADTIQVFQNGSDLNGWTDVNITEPVDSEVTLGAITEGVRSVTDTLSKSVAVDSKLFGRLQVLKSP